MRLLLAAACKWAWQGCETRGQVRQILSDALGWSRILTPLSWKTTQTTWPRSSQWEPEKLFPLSSSLCQVRGWVPSGSSFLKPWVPGKGSGISESVLSSASYLPLPSSRDPEGMVDLDAFLPQASSVNVLGVSGSAPWALRSAMS